MSKNAAAITAVIGASGSGKSLYLKQTLTLICEELADVTQPAWAPPGLSVDTRKGRHRGLKVYGASQRPAAIDKHFFGNATVIRTGQLNFEADLRVMANVLGVTLEEIRDLKPLAWIERDMQSGARRGGVIAVPRVDSI